MKPYLLDTNVLLALAWPNHVLHQDAVDWFVKKGGAGFRTCPITQTGFVRISSNPAFTRSAVTPAEAFALLDRITKLPGHDFWPDDLALGRVFESSSLIAGHRQVTDAYPLVLAAEKGGVMATLDEGVRYLAAENPDCVEVVLRR